MRNPSRLRCAPQAVAKRLGQNIKEPDRLVSSQLKSCDGRFFFRSRRERAPGPQSRPLVVASRRFAAKEERLSQVSSQPKERDRVPGATRRVAAGALSRREA